MNRSHISTSENVYFTKSENDLIALQCTDLRWMSVQHHEAKLLRADAAEVDVVGATGGDDAVEERHSLLAGVARTPAVILRT